MNQKSSMSHRLSKFFLSICLGLSFIFTMTSCKQEVHDVIVENHFDSLQLAPFVESDFPFITASIDLRELGERYPGDNAVVRGLTVQLGNEAYASFDTDLLRWSVAWTGEFLDLLGMAHVSYEDFFNKKNRIPLVKGQPQMATGMYPGWTTKAFAHEDPRKPNMREGGFKWGPIPPDQAAWQGVYVNGHRVMMNYEVAGAKIEEMPGSYAFGNQVGFLRTISIEDQSQDLFLNLAEVLDGSNVEEKEGRVYLYSGPEQDTVTAVAILNGSSDISLLHKDQRFLAAQFEKTNKKTNQTLVIWSGDVANLPAFEASLDTIKVEKPVFDKGGSPYWTEAVYTKGKLSPDTAAYVSDEIILPLPNPWKRNFRAADIDFFEDGRAAVVTFSGDVWLAEGMDGDLTEIKWTRFASGLYEPMSVVVINEMIHVFGKDGIIQLHDLNGDGVADYYKNFCNLMEQSIESREWAADMVLAPDGSIFVAKGGTLNAGPKFSPLATKGFRVGSNQDGTVLKISSDGKTVTQYASGFRGPYLGMNPKTGYLTASDQQGNYVPSSPIMLINEGDYYGVPSTTHRLDTPAITKPLLWVPHNVDQSGLGQVWITGDKMGPLQDDLIHLSFGRPGLFRVLLDSTSNDVQGGISYLPGYYPAPTNKGVMNPVDGQLYVAGFNLWGSKSKVVSAMLRLRYTGAEFYLPEGFKAGQQGVILQFENELDEEMAENPGNFIVKRWNYDRTEEYGSGYFKMDGSPGQDVIPVLASHLSEDGKSVLLVVPNMNEVMQMEIDYRLTSNGQAIEDEFWLTVNDLEPLALEELGFGDVEIGDLNIDISQLDIESKSEEKPSIAKGEAIFKNMACIGCHSSGTVTKGMYGPPFQDLFGSTRTFNDGSSRKADAEYIRSSILTPDLEVVEGYDSEMPSFVGILSDTDIESLTLYIQSLSKH